MKKSAKLSFNTYINFNVFAIYYFVRERLGILRIKKNSFILYTSREIKSHKQSHGALSTHDCKKAEKQIFTFSHGRPCGAEQSGAAPSFITPVCTINTGTAVDKASI